MLDMVVEQLGQITDKILVFRKDRRELADSALRAISHALDETYIYYQQMERGSERNLDIESQLVKYWSAAAIPMRHIDPSLAEICDLKSEYWLNPDNWSKGKVYIKGIGLQSVRNRYRELLRPRSLIRRRET